MLLILILPTSTNIAFYYSEILSQGFFITDPKHSIFDVESVIQSLVKPSITINIRNHLVGGWATPLKNMELNWDDYSQYMGK